ncbi:MAG: hypothetical protein WAO58_05690 [Fimbriimonadaceae bacterium]
MRKLTATALFVLSLWSQSGAESKYKVFDSGADFDSTGIGEGGMMAGQARGSFAYDRTKGLSEIPPFQGWQIWAEDVNSNGTVVGGTFYNSLKVSFIWDRVHGTRVLDDFNGTSHYAFGINDNGDVVGRYFPEIGFPQAYLWRPGQGWIGLPAKYGGWCGAMKINNAGEILGYTQVDQDTSTIVIWRPNGSIVDMGNMASIRTLRSTSITTATCVGALSVHLARSDTSGIRMVSATPRLAILIVPAPLRRQTA